MPFRSSLGSSRSVRDASGGFPPNAAPALYYASSPGEYSALVMLVQVEGGVSIANVYGSFDPNVLGGSFNLPPPDMMNEPMPPQPVAGSAGIGGAPIESAPFNATVLVTADAATDDAAGSSGTAPADAGSRNGAMDMTIMQMTAFNGDASGREYFSRPNGPPPCTAFNYLIMVMGAQDGVFSIKPKGWKAGDTVPFTFDVSKMTPLAFTDLSVPGKWCKPVPAAAAPASAAAPLSVDSRSEGSTSYIWIVIIAALLGVAILAYVRARSGSKGGA